MKQVWIALAFAAAGCSSESAAAPADNILTLAPSSDFDRTCKATSDCMITYLATSGRDMCCPSCWPTALSQAGFAKLTAACKKPNKHGCSPDSCLIVLQHAECVSQVCTAVVGADAPAKP